MRPLASTVAACVAVAVAVLGEAPARAAGPVQLVYHRGAGADECPTEEPLREEVANRLGRDPFAVAGEDRLDVELSFVDGVLRGRFALERGGRELGAQTLQTQGAPGGHRAGHAASNCEELVDAIGLEVALALEASAVTEARAAEAPPPVSAPPAAVEVDRPAPVAAPPDRWSLWAGGGARGSIGSWAEAAFAPELAAEARHGWLGIGVDARVDVIPSLAVQSASASVVRPSGSLLGCAHRGWFYGCGVGTLGATVVHGLDLGSSRTAADPYAAFGGRAGIDLALDERLHLLPFVEMVGVATPTTVRIDAAQGASPTVSSRSWDGAAGIGLFGSIL